MAKRCLWSIGWLARSDTRRRHARARFIIDRHQHEFGLDGHFKMPTSFILSEAAGWMVMMTGWHPLHSIIALYVCLDGAVCGHHNQNTHCRQPAIRCCKAFTIWRLHNLVHYWMAGCCSQPASSLSVAIRLFSSYPPAAMGYRDKYFRSWSGTAVGSFSHIIHYYV